MKKSMWKVNVKHSVHANPRFVRVTKSVHKIFPGKVFQVWIRLPLYPPDGQKCLSTKAVKWVWSKVKYQGAQD